MSKNGVALLILILSMFGVEVVESQVVEVVAAVSTLASLGLMLWNQWQRSDVRGFLWKTKE